MSSREELIARKHEVRRRIEAAQRQLSTLRVSPKPRHREVRKLEEEIERLMAEESSLRVEIDQSA
jgi:chromosome segregation ATPase